MGWLRTVALLLAILGIACERGRTSVDIELDVFSGRPNPKWSVSDSEAARLQKSISSLTEKAGAPAIPDLGFRGYVVTSGTRRFRVFRDRVQRGESWYKDTAGIESDLKKQAADRGFGAIVNN